MFKYRGVKITYLGLHRYRIEFSPECSMDRICRDGIGQVIREINYHLDYKDIWGLW